MHLNMNKMSGTEMEDFERALGTRMTNLQSDATGLIAANWIAYRRENPEATIDEVRDWGWDKLQSLDLVPLGAKPDPIEESG